MANMIEELLDKYQRTTKRKTKNNMGEIMQKYLLHIEPIEITEEEYKDIKKIGFEDWIFEQAELQNIEQNRIEKIKEKR
jgi:hypothetical protein